MSEEAILLIRAIFIVFSMFCLIKAGIAALKLAAWREQQQESRRQVGNATFILLACQTVVERGYLLPVRLVLSARYIGMRRELVDLRERVAKAEGAYYLTDAQTWGEKHGELERRAAKAEAEAYGLTRRVEFLEEMIQTYRDTMGVNEDFRQNLIRRSKLMRNKQGRFITDPANYEPTEEPLEEDLYYSLSAEEEEAARQAEEAARDPFRESDAAATNFTNREDVQLREHLRVVRSDTTQPRESKKVRAFKMSARGAQPEAIAEALNISLGTVGSYVSAGKRELEKQQMSVTADGHNYHSVNGVELEKMRNRANT